MALQRLRGALAGDLDAWTGQGDDDVIRLAAVARLASGAWTVAYDDVAPAAVPVVSRLGKAPGASVPASVRAGRSPLPASSTALSAGTAAAAREWPESANQVAQAVTLERAVVSATPFCAICAERARARGRCCCCRKRAMNDATLDALTHLLWPDSDRLDGPQVHWLLDDARDPQVARLVRFGKLEYACLFSGRLHPRLEAAAPYLVHLAAGSPTTNLLLRRGWAMPAASSRWRRRTSR